MLGGAGGRSGNERKGASTYEGYSCKPQMHETDIQKACMPEREATELKLRDLHGVCRPSEAAEVAVGASSDAAHRLRVRMMAGQHCLQPLRAHASAFGSIQ